MARASPCSRSTHLNTSKMVIAGTTKARLSAIKARKCSACRPLVKTSIQPEESTTARLRVTGDLPRAGRCFCPAENREAPPETE